MYLILNLLAQFRSILYENHEKHQIGSSFKNNITKYLNCKYLILLKFENPSLS